MNRMMSRLFSATLAAALALPGAAFGAGFQINEHNAKATARAGAVVSTVDDASGIFYNPAGLGWVKGTNLQVGVSLIRPRGEYQGAGLPSTRPEGATGDVTQGTQAAFVAIPNIYAAHALSDRATIGMGFYAPYGLGIDWGTDTEWVGRTVVQDLSLRTYFMTPTIALKVNDDITVGVSVSLVPATLRLQRVLGTPDTGDVLFPAATVEQEGSVKLTGSAFGVGANVGIQARLLENLRLGFAFKSAIGLDFTGNADFRLPAGTPTSIQARFPDGAVSGAVTLPNVFALGIGWVDGPLEVEVASYLTLWQSYDELRINFDSGLPQAFTRSPRDWTASPNFRIGGQYSFDEYALRLGLVYDVSPVPDATIDPTLPDNDRVIFSLGGGTSFGPVNLDLAYMGVFVLSRESTGSVNFVNGTYNGGLVHVIGASVGASL
jgi:long-chain fatty acid transport protein